MTGAEVAVSPGEVAGSGVVSKGLKVGALGLLSSIVIGVASTAPAYSLAAALGVVTASVALFSPAVMVLAFVPMLFIAIAYNYMNRADPDCGTTFTWVTRAMGLGVAVFYYSNPDNSFVTGQAWFSFVHFDVHVLGIHLYVKRGLGPPLVFGVGLLLLGLPLMVYWRIRHPEPFFRRTREAAESLDSRVPPLAPEVLGLAD